MKHPSNISELRKCWLVGQRCDFFLFYGHKPPEQGVDASCLSQWFVCEFEIDGHRYPTAEHWMMAEKARLFEDDEMLQEILACETPREAKAFGRQVTGFEPAIWDRHKFEIVVRGNRAKFAQNKPLKEFLIATADSNPAAEATYQDGPELLVAEPRSTYQIEEYSELAGQKNKDVTAGNSSSVILVEAAGRDTIWGIGLGVSNPKSQDPLQWRGQNLLGFALTQVREQFINEDCDD